MKAAAKPLTYLIQLRERCVHLPLFLGKNCVHLDWVLCSFPRENWELEIHVVQRSFCMSR